jgi:hypothetical protein
MMLTSQQRLSRWQSAPAEDVAPKKKSRHFYFAATASFSTMYLANTHMPAKVAAKKDFIRNCK